MLQFVHHCILGNILHQNGLQFEKIYCFHCNIMSFIISNWKKCKIKNYCIVFPIKLHLVICTCSPTYIPCYELFWFSQTETSLNKIKVANDSPCSVFIFPNGIVHQNKVKFENVGVSRTSHRNAQILVYERRKKTVYTWRCSLWT